MRKLSEEKLAAERERLEQMKSYERQYGDHILVCGIDEAGRGPLAGPVVAGAVILPGSCQRRGARNCFWRSRRKR